MPFAGSGGSVTPATETSASICCARVAESGAEPAVMPNESRPMSSDAGTSCPTTGSCESRKAVLAAIAP
jgi:hypothetical protein